MRLRTYATAGLPVAVVIALAAAGCGSSNSSDSGSGSAATTSGAASSSGGGYGYGGGATTAPKTTAAAGTSQATVKTASTPLGTILVDDSGRTLYLWEADRTARSTCDGACAQAWPPLTTSGAARAAGGAQATLLGTVRRSDGTMQVTYAQHPLYYYSGDTAAGQTSGQNSDGFGAEWYVVTPTGAADEHGSS